MISKQFREKLNRLLFLDQNGQEINSQLKLQKPKKIFFVIEEELLFIFKKEGFEKTIKKGDQIELKVPKAISNDEETVNVYEVKTNQKIYLSLQESLDWNKAAIRNFFWGGLFFISFGVLRIIYSLWKK